VIDRDTFDQVWASLEDRLNRKHSVDTHTMYYAFLTPQMDTAEFLAAASALWAGATWWPRPVDFILAAARGEWTLVQEAAEAHYGPDWPAVNGYPDGRRAPWPLVSERSKEAVRIVGGIAAVRAACEKDPVRAREAWEKALEQVAAEAATKIAPAGVFKALAPGVRRLNP
jgi:hypothetical protein